MTNSRDVLSQVHQRDRVLGGFTELISRAQHHSRSVSINYSAFHTSLRTLFSAIFVLAIEREEASLGHHSPYKLLEVMRASVTASSAG